MGDDATAQAAYAAATARPVPTDAELAPFRAARELEAVAWLLAMAVHHPARYRAVADERVAALLG